MYWLNLLLIGPVFWSLLSVGAPEVSSPDEHASQAMVKLNYTVDKMIYERVLEAPLGGDNLEAKLPIAERQHVRLQINEDGSLFMDIAILDSPWKTDIPHEHGQAHESATKRISVSPGKLSVYDGVGRLLHQQEVEDFSLGEELFSQGFDPINLWMIEMGYGDGVPAGDGSNKLKTLLDNGGVLLEDGFVSIQSCGQTGTLRTSCTPGDCSRVIYDPNILRPVMAEFSKPGEAPYSVQYFKWSGDGKQLERSLEHETLEFSDGRKVEVETVSYFTNYSLTK